MPGKLFIGNLSFEAVEADLEQFCSELNVQTASIKIMRDMEMGRSRGFGFIELAAETDMETAIQAMNGKELKQRALTVNEARPPRKRDFGGGQRFDSRPSGGGGFDSRRKKRERPKRRIEELY